MINILSHKSPDTDSLCGSIVFQDFLEKKWKKSQCFKLWELNKETKLILQKLKIEEPKTIKTLEKWAKVALIDHNEKKQAIDNLEELNIEYVIDHHKFWNFWTSEPLFIRAEKLCSTNSILFKMYKEAWFEISQKIAILMAASILSDSLNFRSATTTKEDVQIFEEINKIAKIENVDEFAKEMFDAKSDLWSFSIEQIIKYDYKEFDFNWTKACIWVLETTNPDFSLSKKEEIIQWMKKIKKEDWLDFILLSVVDIFNEKNTSIVLNWFEEKIIEKVFWEKVENNLVNLWKRLSRKKQILPFLDKYFLG